MPAELHNLKHRHQFICRSWNRWRVHRLSQTGLLMLLACWACVAITNNSIAQESATVASAKAAENPNAVVAANHSWNLFRGDPGSQGVAQSDLPATLELVWKTTLPDESFEGAAAINDGVAYLASLDGAVFALDLADGKQLWKLQTEMGFATSPSFKEGRLFLGDFDGVFHCVDAKSGKLAWKFQAEAEINSCANFYGDNVLFGSQDATLYCLDAATGKVVWKHSIDDQIRCTPSIAGNRCFLAGCDAKLHIINLDKGESAGAVEIDGPTGATPAVAGDIAYCGTEGSTFFAIDWKKEDVLWTFRDDERAQPFRSSPAVQDNMIVVGGRSKQVYGLARDTGKKIWTFKTKKQVDSSPVIVGSRVFVGSRDGRLYGLDLTTGKEVWQYETGGALLASPAVASRKLIIASDEGVIFCFGEKQPQ